MADGTVHARVFGGSADTQMVELASWDAGWTAADGTVYVRQYYAEGDWPAATTVALIPKGDDPVMHQAAVDEFMLWHRPPPGSVVDAL